MKNALNSTVVSLGTRALAVFVFVRLFCNSSTCSRSVKFVSGSTLHRPVSVTSVRRDFSISVLSEVLFFQIKNFRMSDTPSKRACLRSAGTPLKESGRTVSRRATPVKKTPAKKTPVKKTPTSTRVRKKVSKYSPEKTPTKKRSTKANASVQGTPATGTPKQDGPEKVWPDDQETKPIELNVYQKYKHALSTTIKTDLWFREKEANEIRSFLSDHIKKKKSTSIYISGEWPL